MQKLLTLAIVLVSFLSQSFAISFNSNSIPDSLKKEANAVIRFHNTHLELNEKGQLKGSVHYAITVLNAEGKSHGYFSESYDKNKKLSIKILNGYNKYGVKSDRINKKIINDYSNHGSYSYFSDQRVKVATPNNESYPYTVEYKYEFSQKGYINVSNWAPIESYNVALQKASLTLVSSGEDLIRYKPVNAEFDFLKSTNKDKTSFQWKIRNVKPIKSESYEPSVFKILPMVLIAPNNFIYHGHSGSMKTWKDYGLWVNTLLAERNILPNADVQEVKQLVEGMDNDYDKAKAIYEYMQHKTRYVSIQLGIGGFQPMSATEVAETGYGDCKALSNYTMALLEVAGIKSYYTEIGSGSNQYIIYPEFPSASQTNHVILTVPFKKDTVFLECTSKTKPFGYIGRSNSARKALMMTENGGKLVSIPLYPAEENYRSRTVKLNVSENGAAVCKTDEWYGCAQFESVIARLLHMSNEEQRKYLLASFNLNTAKLGKVSVSEVKSRKPKGNLQLDLSIEKYASKLGNRLIFNVNPEIDEVATLDKDKERHLEIVRNIGYVDTDSVHIGIPDGYAVEYMPKTFDFTSKYGKYNCTIKQISPTKLLYVRSLKIQQGSFPKTEHKDYAGFLQKVAKADSEKIVLKKS